MNFSDLLTGMTGYVGILTDDAKIKQMDTAYANGFNSGVVNTVPHGKKLFYRKQDDGTRYARVQIKVNDVTRNVYVCKFVELDPSGAEKPYVVFMGSLFRTVNSRNLPKKSNSPANHNEPTFNNWPEIPGQVINSADAMLDFLASSGSAIMFESEPHTWDIERRDGTPVNKGAAYRWNLVQ